MSRNKTLAVKDKLIVIFAIFAAWLISFGIWNLYQPSSWSMALLMMLVCSAITVVPYIALTRFYGMQYETYMKTRSHGFYATLGGSVIAGSMVLTLLFPGEFHIEPISLNTIVPTILFVIFWRAVTPTLSCELFFRGTLQPHLKDYLGSLGANAVTSLLYAGMLSFMLYHQFSFLLFLALFAESLALGAASEKSQSVWTACFMHALIDGLLHNGFFYFGDHFEDIFYSLKLTTAGDVITGGKFGILASYQAIIGFLLVFAVITMIDAFQVSKVERHHHHVVEEENIPVPEEKEEPEVKMPPLPVRHTIPVEEVPSEPESYTSVIDHVLDDPDIDRIQVPRHQKAEPAVKPLAERSIQDPEVALPPLEIKPKEMPALPQDNTPVQEEESTEQFDVSRPMTPEEVRRAREAALRHYQKH